MHLRASNLRMRHLAKAVALLCLAVSCRPSPVRAQARPGSAEELLFNSANRERTMRGLPALKWDAQLAAAAQKHAAAMAQQNTLSHQLTGEPDPPTRARDAGARFSALAENVAFAPTAPELHTEWMNSPPHRQNLLDPQMTSVGIAVAPRGQQLFAAEDFSRAVAVLSLDEQEGRVRAQLKARGIMILTDDVDARSVCQLGPGHAASARPSYRMQYTSTDLNQLPDAVLQTIRSGRYRSAEVGACPPANKDDFAEYQVAVVFYQ